MMDSSRTERTRSAVLAAARDLVIASGYRAATVEAIAAQARVGKPTIYRRWENRAAVVADALLADARALVPVPDTGSARTDLQRYLRLIARAVTVEPPGMALAGVIGEAQLDPQLAQRIATGLIGELTADCAVIFQRGVERGELRADLDLQVLHDGVYGPLFYRLLVSQAPLSEPFIDTLIEQVLAGAAS